MKIAYVLGEYPSLSETFLAREIEALKKRGFEIEIWALRAGEGARQIPVSTFSRAAFRFSRNEESYGCAMGKSWAAREFENLKNVHHIHAGWASLPAWIACGAAGVLHLPWSFFGHARDLWVEGGDLKSKIQAAKFAACCTRAGTQHLKKLAPEFEEKIFCAPHGLELSDYEFRVPGEKRARCHVLAVGRLVEKKGFPVLLRAASRLGQEYSLRTTIIGDGPQRGALEKQAANFRGSILHLVGAVPPHQVIAAMHNADLFVMPSIEAADGDRDGVPNVLLEAAACGLPIVSTRAGAIEEFLDESCARLCAPDDADALAQTMKNALGNYDESLRRARVARKRVEENFDIEKNIEVLARAFSS